MAAAAGAAEAIAEAAAAQDFLPDHGPLLPPSLSLLLSIFPLFRNYVRPVVFLIHSRSLQKWTDRMTASVRGRGGGPLKSFREKSLNCQIDPLVGTPLARSAAACLFKQRERAGERGSGRRMALEGSLKGAIAESVTRSPSKQGASAAASVAVWCVRAAAAAA